MNLACRISDNIRMSKRAISAAVGGSLPLFRSCLAMAKSIVRNRRSAERLTQTIIREASKLRQKENSAFVTFPVHSCKTGKEPVKNMHSASSPSLAGDHRRRTRHWVERKAIGASCRRLQETGCLRRRS